MNAFFILVMRTFFQTSVPDALIEAAKIDGSGEFRTFLQIVLPISLPGIATIGLFCTLGYWNDWFNALLYIDDASLVPLQAMLMRIQNNMEFVIQNSMQMGSSFEIAATLPTETVRMAMVVLATLPIALAYPFFQKYFVKGLTVGSLKE
ncbi:L-arabinose transport system permease protein AraQ [compost metagenome]